MRWIGGAGFGAAQSRDTRLRDATAEPNKSAPNYMREPCAPAGSDPHKWGPSSAVRRARLRGCAPDPVPEALVREGAHKAAFENVCSGRSASVGSGITLVSQT